MQLTEHAKQLRVCTGHLVPANIHSSDPSELSVWPIHR